MRPRTIPNPFKCLRPIPALAVLEIAMLYFLIYAFVFGCGDFINMHYILYRFIELNVLWIRSCDASSLVLRDNDSNYIELFKFKIVQFRWRFFIKCIKIFIYIHTYIWDLQKLTDVTLPKRQKRIWNCLSNGPSFSKNLQKVVLSPCWKWSFSCWNAYGGVNISGLV